jgi:hypothetical protein
MPPTSKIPPASRVVGGVFGLAFAGIGLTVLGFLWFGHDAMGDPPVFFKIVGSFIALVFVVMGGTMALSALTGGGLMADNPSQISSSDFPPRQSAAPPRAALGAYTCPHCGAGLSRDAEVSPLGDVKCPFCGRWFNVHGKS